MSLNLGDRSLKKSIKAIIIIGLCWLISCSLTACSLPQPVSAQERLFRDLQLDFLGSQVLPKSSFQNTPVGGLSALTYDKQENLYYALSDDRSNLAPARFYTLSLDIQQQESGKIGIDQVKIQGVTTLKDETGNNYESGTIDGEGMVLSPRRTLFISSEGNPSKDIEPFIGEFEIATGKKISSVRIPERFLPSNDPENGNPENQTTQIKGIRNNLAFESLTVNQSGLLPDDPFRLFTATESALAQDLATQEPLSIRFLHYLINPFGQPIIVGEHLYPLEPTEPDIISNGLTEILALKKEGYFLSLERTFGFAGSGAKIFQVVNASATDTSTFKNLKEIAGVQPLQKELVLNLQDLDLELDNLEGMTVGARLPDGDRSLILISDDNFNDEQETQLLLFRLRAEAE